jgi:hypothetical protein
VVYEARAGLHVEQYSPSLSRILNFTLRRHRSHLRLGHREKRKRDEGIQGGYASAKQNFHCKIGIAAVRDYGITTRRADAAEPSRCRRTRRG